MVTSLYKNSHGKQMILDFYDRSVRNLEVECSDLILPTRYGDTHLLVAGPEGAPPVIMLHGGNAVNPVNASLVCTAHGPSQPKFPRR